MQKRDVKHLVRELRRSLEYTQEQVATRSRGILRRVDVNKVESGANAANSARVRTGLAAAFDLSRDDLAEYLDGSISVDEVLARRICRRGTDRLAHIGVQYQNLMSVLVRLDGLLPPPVEVYLASVRLHGREDMTEAEWLAEAIEASNRYRRTGQIP